MRSSSIDASAMRSVPRIRQVRKIMESSIEHSNLSSTEQDRTTPVSCLHLFTAALDLSWRHKATG